MTCPNFLLASATSMTSFLKTQTSHTSKSDSAQCKNYLLRIEPEKLCSSEFWKMLIETRLWFNVTWMIPDLTVSIIRQALTRGVKVEPDELCSFRFYHGSCGTICDLKRFGRCVIWHEHNSSGSMLKPDELCSGWKDDFFVIWLQTTNETTWARHKMWTRLIMRILNKLDASGLIWCWNINKVVCSFAFNVLGA